MLNKKVLSKINLGSYKKPNPYSKDIIYDPKGQWKYPGQNTRIPGEDITMQGVPYPVYAQPNIGKPQMMYPDQNYQFPGADYVDEFPQMKKGGRTKGLVSMPKPSKKGLMSKKYSRSLDATNKLFTENFLFAKPKSRKNKVFDPNSKYYAEGGEYEDADLTPEEIKEYRANGYIVDDTIYAEGGALLTKKVTCKKCGWKWDAEDGGNDITTCHKCGGQGLIHAQDGGEPCPKGYIPYNGQCVKWEEPKYKHGEKTGYDEVTGSIITDPNQPYHKTKEWLEHEKYHHLQNLAGGLSTKKQKPIPGIHNQKYIDDYYDKREIEWEDATDNFPKNHPDRLTKLLKDPIYKDKDTLRAYIKNTHYKDDNNHSPGEEPIFAGADNDMYNNPTTIEGSAQKYQNDIEGGMPSMFPNNYTPDFIKFSNFFMFPKKQNGGITKLTPEEEKQFQNFYKTLPDNLQSDDDTYDIRGYWDSEQRPTEFDYTQPKYKDGFYHGYSINGNTGEYLKSPAHETFQHAIDEDRKIGYRPLTNVQGRNIAIENESIADPEEQSFLNNTEGPINYIEADLNEDEIQAYKDGGYVVEDISIPSLNKRKFAPGGVTDLNPVTMAKYLADLKVQENNEKKGFKNNKWYPHRSVEGGADTIGYGHKLTKADSKLYKGATTEEVEKLLQADVLIKQSEAKKRVDKKYGAGSFDALPQDSQMLVVDYQYNVGLQEFPKFLNALVKGDKDTMLKEYERTTSSGKLTKRNNWAKSVIDNLNYNAEPELIQPNIPLANVPDATVVVPQVIPETIKEIKYQDGGDVISQYGWDYKTDGDQYLTKRTGTENWIPAKGSSLDAIKQKVYNKPIENIVPTEETTISEVPSEVKKDSLPVDASVIEIQQKLKKAGYNLGKDGVDGQMGNITKVALDAFNAGISPDKVKIPDPKKKIKGQEVNYTVNANLKNGYLPYLDTKEEVCIKGKGCSTNVSAKISNLLSNITEESLWANDAWYNKDAVIKQGGDLVYESPSRIYNQMGKVPKEVWSKLQVGDYVQLNRPDTKSSGEFSAKGTSKEGYINEEIEHLGFIVGKDKDGTPLIWHGSETGKAFIKRIDEPISLDDHDKNIFTYQVSSIVRSPALKNADLSGLQNSTYYTPLDKSKKLVAKKDATPLQVEATNIFNDSVGQFKNLGYSQDDANYIGGLLIGGIMQQETKGGTSLAAGSKEAAASLIKNVAGVDAFNISGTDNEFYKAAAQLAGFSGKPVRFPGKEFEGDEASVGQYQLKPNLNFRESNGSLNALGKKLERLGISIEDINSNNIDAQTKAGTLLLLDAYTSLKKDPDFNIKTGLYKNKIPASYIIAKSWQAGKGWYKRDKYKKYLNDFDITYSNNVLRSTLNNIDSINSDKNLYKEYDTIRKGQALTKEQERIRLYKEQIKKDTTLSEYKKRNVFAAESSGVNKSYKEPTKSFNANDYFSKNNMQTTVYKYSGRPGAKYKKDKNGNWYVNDGKSTNNKYIALNDPDGKRSRVLEKSAKPSIAKEKTSIAKAKEGGIVTSLSQDEINQYIRNGYVVEELD